ncbi:hypothetical protein, partial [Guptibacillus hwajinpoensis]|uniref:hypothetical protein n=1 Tax=Guptibacillus hwajinpoensis TaxID=208199 RepID=UPI003D004F52
FIIKNSFSPFFKSFFIFYIFCGVFFLGGVGGGGGPPPPPPPTTYKTAIFAAFVRAHGTPIVPIKLFIQFLAL